MTEPLVVDLCSEEPKGVVWRSESREISRRDFTLRRIFCNRFGLRIDSSTRRILLAAFEYLPFTCLETTASLVCRVWLQVSRDDDLWKRKYIAEFRPTETAANACYRAGFIDLQLGSCWHCRQYINHFGVECQHLGRLLCMTCARLPVCRILPVKTLMKKFFVQRVTFQKLNVPIFDYEHTPSTYVALLTRKLLPIYSRRCDLLIRNLTGSLEKATLKKLQRVDFTHIFEGNCGFKYTAALLNFCGKDEDAEDLTQSLIEFVCRVKKCG